MFPAGENLGDGSDLPILLSPRNSYHIRLARQTSRASCIISRLLASPVVKEEPYLWNHFACIEVKSRTQSAFF